MYNTLRSLQFGFLIHLQRITFDETCKQTGVVDRERLISASGRASLILHCLL